MGSTVLLMKGHEHNCYWG